MAKNVSWDNVPTQLLQIIVSKIDSLDDFVRFSAVSKTWQSVMSEKREVEKALLLPSPQSPFLLLAEEVQGILLTCDIDNDEDEEGYEELEESEEETEEEIEGENDDEEYFGDEGEEEYEYNGDDGDDQNQVDMEEDEDEEDFVDEVGYEEDVDEEVEEIEEEDEDEEVEEFEEEDWEEIEEEDEDEDDFGDEGEEEDEHEYQDDEEDCLDVDQVDSAEENMEVEMEGRRDEDMRVGDDEDMVEEYNSDDPYPQLKISVGNARGIYSLSTGKQYTIDLPEAAGKVILGTNKGWLLTLGKHFETNLLHPLLRQQISLPTMNAFRIGNEYRSCEEVYIKFVLKAVMSSQVQPNEYVLGNDMPDPTIMVIYGESGFLGFARPGDKVWTKVDVPRKCPFIDIAYRRGKFYSIDYEGSTFVCHVDDDSINGRQVRGTLIVEFPLTRPGDFVFKYLVESGSDLWLLVRLRRIKLFKPPNSMRVKYRTRNFLVWKLEEKVSGDGRETLYTWNQKKNLENKAFFIGRNASVSLPSSGCISPNCIYFTDDASELYYPDGGGHDMGVYNVETGTIVPHFPGRSIHPISPPLWYII